MTEKATTLSAVQLLDELVEQYPPLHVCRPTIEQSFLILRECYRNQGKVLICGNGGSAADAEHIVGELMKGFMRKRPLPDPMRERFCTLFPDNGEYLADHLQGALPAIALTGQIALSTAFLNDVAGDMILAQQVYGYVRPGDVVWGISTSGNSQNVINALKVARALGIKTLGLTGKSGGQMKAVCDVLIGVPATVVYRVQEYHLPVYHVLCRLLEEEFFG